MRVFADTNFFTNVLLSLPGSGDARRLRLTLNGRVLPVTPLLQLEMTNAFQRLVFESRHGIQGIRVTPEIALVARAQMDDEVQRGVWCGEQDIDNEALKMSFDLLVYRHTAKHGFRTYDILHVASALILGCDTFWSFDERAKKLAKLEGLQVNP